ncbi:putative DNA recombination and repair protein Rad51 [Rosa chinensis]|uniref:Putative DNA recombination and repair protein Rad51 n=1 Tax=Rosa chinensis TaxID=74649 RepID=A0A2P6QPM3_ROSCH|nr:putative DNA recombination and repair protein Rad51 [Rosa chinensis]
MIAQGINAGDVKKLQDAGIYTWQFTKKLPTNMHGGNGKVAYIDTEGTLYPFPLSIQTNVSCCFLSTKDDQELST